MIIDQQYTVQVFEKNGTFRYQFGIPGKEEGQLWYPRKVKIINHVNVSITHRANVFWEVSWKATCFLRIHSIKVAVMKSILRSFFKSDLYILKNSIKGCCDEKHFKKFFLKATCSSRTQSKVALMKSILRSLFKIGCF